MPSNNKEHKKRKDKKSHVSQISGVNVVYSEPELTLYEDGGFSAEGPGFSASVEPPKTPLNFFARVWQNLCASIKSFISYFLPTKNKKNVKPKSSPIKIKPIEPIEPIKPIKIKPIKPIKPIVGSAPSSEAELVADGYEFYSNSKTDILYYKQGSTTVTQKEDGSGRIVIEGPKVIGLPKK